MASTLEDVTSVVISTLGIQDRATAFDAATPLLGSLPELDSRSVLELVLVLEVRFDIAIDDDEIIGEIFETVGSLAAFVDSKRRSDRSS